MRRLALQTESSVALKTSSTVHCCAFSQFRCFSRCLWSVSPRQTCNARVNCSTSTLCHVYFTWVDKIEKKICTNKMERCKMRPRRDTKQLNVGMFSVFGRTAWTNKLSHLHAHLPYAPQPHSTQQIAKPNSIMCCRALSPATWSEFRGG